MPKNVFVLGLDEQNHRILQHLPDRSEYHFHPLLTVKALTSGQVDLRELLDRANAQLETFEGSVDAIVGYWDFPVSSMVPILCRRWNLPSASLNAVLKCEHKYWSRLEQQKAIDEHPRFGLVGLDDESPPESVGYPMWIKPVKAYSSELAFRVDDDETFRSALAKIRAGIGRVGSPFEFALSHAELPPEIANVGGRRCLAEEAVSGQQVTVEGYNNDGEIHVYGVVDSYHYEGTSCFQRYQYPSRLPREVTDRLAAVSERVITRIGLRSVFNIEYFWKPETGAVHLLEINPRQSQSHAMLFEQVDGVSNHQCMLRLAMRRPPEMPYRQGPYAVAAKWFCRRFSDAVVRRAPALDEVEALQRDIPGVLVDPTAREGDRLSDLRGQDSYSYNYAVVHVGADTEDELKDKYERCVRALPYEFD